MASSKAHHATGWAAGFIAAALVVRAGVPDPYHVWAAGSFIAGLAGSTAPDWLEVAWWSKRRRRWVSHRSVTHWGMGWGLLAWLGYHGLHTHPGAALVFGLACGGLMHLLADWPNPLGVPWIFRRHSLRWWNSGRWDWLVVAASWTVALAVADFVWFNGTYSARFAHALGSAWRRG